MALRLMGEEYAVIQGVDDLGWLREITVNSSDPGVKIDQQGTGPILELRDNGSIVALVKDGGGVELTQSLAVGVTPASSGLIRLPRDGNAIKARNQADTTDLIVAGINSGNGLELGSGAPEVISMSTFRLKAPAYWDTGSSINSGRYELGRNNDATNRMQFNVPTGALHEFSVNNAERMTIGTTIDMNNVRIDGSNRVISALFISTGLTLDLTNPKLTANGASDLRLVSGSGHVIVETELEVDGALNHDGSNVGFYGVAPVAQSAKINDPTGGATVDAEARTAINTVIDALEGIGVTASV